MSPKTQSFNRSPLYLVMNIPIILWLSIPEAPSIRCWMLCGWLRVEGLSPIQRKTGEPPPPNPLFQGLLSADLHMKWSLIHSRSVKSPKPATAEALAERGLSQKASNWPVIRLWKLRGLAGQVATTAERENGERNRWEKPVTYSQKK